MTLKRSSSDSNKKTVEYIKKNIRTIDSPEKSINLFHCLNELGDHSLVEEIQHYLTSGTIKEVKLSSSQWSAVVFVLLTSEEELNEFRLDEFVKGKNNLENMEVLQKLLPVIKESRSVQLSDCGVTDEGCSALASALRSNLSHLRELNLSGNKVGDLGVKSLCAGLEDPHCKLEILWLVDCGVTDEGCASLASALRSNPSHLRHLDLSMNKLGKSVNLLSDVLQNPHCKLEILCPDPHHCAVFLHQDFCLTTAHQRCFLTHDSHQGKSSGLKDPFCQKFRMNDDEGCVALASALRSNPSHLRHLDLTQNKLGDLGVKRLCAGLEDPHCKLEILWLSYCGLTDEGCAALASALRSNPSHLRQLDLSVNKLGDSGVKLISDLKDDPHYKLETLNYCEYIII
uniref:NACHT LRR and PYD domain-containing protein n=1 Tax=Sinocyclocheilus rhinocerous TaxID=307959 RepID=A0A673FPH7_9TELE